MQAIAERVPAHVVGTHSYGRGTRADHQRRPAAASATKVLTRIKVDDAAIELVREQALR